MNPNDTAGRLYALELADEMVKRYRLTEASIEKQIDRTLSIISYMLYEMTEQDLRDYFLMSGVDLNDYNSFKESQAYVSWYVAAGVLEVTEHFSYSLVSLDSYLVERYKWDEEMQTRMNDMKMEGIFFRDMLLSDVD